MRVVATNDAAIVFAQDTLNVFYADLGAPQTATPTRRLLTFNRWFGNSGHDLFVARHLNAAQKLYFAREFLVNHRDPSETDGLGKVIVSPSVATGIPFTNSGLIFINPNDMMMDHTLLHEYGHYAQESIGAYYIAPRFHSLCAITDPQYAWFEGFPTFFSRAVRLFYPGEFNVPSSPASCMRSGDQAAIEGVVSDVLVWLLNDAGGARRIMSIFDKEFDYSAPGNKDLRRFREVWSNRRASMTYIDWVYQRFGLLP